KLPAMPVKRLFTLVFTAILLSSCVSSKVHKDLQEQYDSLESRNQKLSQDLRETRTKGEKDIAALQEEYNRLKTERDQINTELERTRQNLQGLTSSYDALEANSSTALAENSKRNRELLSQLEDKEKALATEQARLEKLQKDLTARSNRIN